MKKVTAILLTLLLLLPTSTYVQEDSALTNRMSFLKRSLTQFNTTIDHYTKCFKVTCSPEEKKERWDTVYTTFKITVQAALALLVLLYITKHVSTKVQEKRKTLKLGEPTVVF